MKKCCLCGGMAFKTIDDCYVCYLCESEEKRETELAARRWAVNHITLSVSRPAKGSRLAARASRSNHTTHPPKTSW